MWSRLLMFLLLVSPYCCSRTKRVMNGHFARRSDYPFVVALVDSSVQGEFEYIFGTGTILSERWVLTAAHLWLKRDDGFPQRTKANSVIRYGRDSIVRGEGETAAVEEVVPNHQYKDEYVYYKFDIALLKTTLKFQNGIAMPLTKVTKFGFVHAPSHKCNVAGYGRNELDASEDQTDLMSVATMSILADDKCQNIIPLVNGLYCAFQPEVGVCEGDSGAPMICDGKLYGIHTRGMACNRNNKMGVSMWLKVDFFRFFIKDTTGLTYWDD